MGFAEHFRNTLKEMVIIDQTEFFVDIFGGNDKDDLVLMKVIMMGLSAVCCSICMMIVIYFSIRLLRLKYGRNKDDEDAATEYLENVWNESSREPEMCNVQLSL